MKELIDSDMDKLTVGKWAQAMLQTTILEYGENSSEVSTLENAFSATEIVPDK
ncbi:hypothetical protein [Lacticaseibacillus saniviri]